MQYGMMISGIIYQHKHLTACMTADLSKFFHEFPEGLCVKDRLFTLVSKFSVTQAYGSKIANAFSRWMLQYYWVLTLRRNPDTAP
jgi:hypothetical protein